EKLYDVQRAQIERVFRRPVHERYGARDVGDMGFQYLEEGSLHFDVDWPDLVVEPEVAATEAPILVTKLHGDGMPMIRYVNDDMAAFPAGARPGYPAWRLDAILGRRADRILLPGGTAVHGLHFPHLLKDYPIRDFRVHQSADYSVQVQLVPKPGFSGDTRAALEANLAANLGGVRFCVELVDTIDRTRANKWRPVTSDVAQPAR
ncbi:MAG TPA: hypothetical protein VNH46_05080, partial [Gemmatimonadales bacterium]|nr:hypothetical protein [Gemmatimonadales bacterium]